MARARRRKPIKSSFHDGSFPVFQEVSPTWKAIKQEQIFMDNTRTRRKPVSAEAIARHAKRLISNIWHEGATPLLSGGKVLAPATGSSTDFQPLRYLLKKSRVRCQASLAAASS
jgi:hypothetical protein